MSGNKDKVYLEYKRKTNMTYSELKRWASNPCSKKASMDRKPIQRNLRLLKKNKSKWNEQDLKDAKKTIAFISRMKNVSAGNPVKGCKESKRTISLKNWGYDPNK